MAAEWTILSVEPVDILLSHKAMRAEEPKVWKVEP